MKSTSIVAIIACASIVFPSIIASTTSPVPTDSPVLGDASDFDEDPVCTPRHDEGATRFRRAGLQRDPHVFPAANGGYTFTWWQTSLQSSEEHSRDDLRVGRLPHIGGALDVASLPKEPETHPLGYDAVRDGQERLHMVWLEASESGRHAIRYVLASGDRGIDLEDRTLIPVDSSSVTGASISVGPDDVAHILVRLDRGDGTLLYHTALDLERDDWLPLHPLGSIGDGGAELIFDASGEAWLIAASITPVPNPRQEPVLEHTSLYSYELTANSFDLERREFDESVPLASSAAGLSPGGFEAIVHPATGAIHVTWSVYRSDGYEIMHSQKLPGKPFTPPHAILRVEQSRSAMYHKIVPSPQSEGLFMIVWKHTCRGELEHFRFDIWEVSAQSPSRARGSFPFAAGGMDPAFDACITDGGEVLILWTASDPVSREDDLYLKAWVLGPSGN